MTTKIKIFKAGQFDIDQHWYPKALNATIHPMVAFFLNLSTQRIVERYCHLRPKADRAALTELLSFQPKYFRWSGADLINVTDQAGKRQMVVIENNSCPSGQKSMPLLDEHDDLGGYRTLIEKTLVPMIKGAPVQGVLAVLYDKNYMEASGYASAMADIIGSEVYLVYFPDDQDSELIKLEDDILYLKNEQGQWLAIKAIFRYLTNKPWNRLPIYSKTRILNPIIACLAGGRNKLVASKAYESFNKSLEDTGLSINVPITIWDVEKSDIPAWVAQMGGHAVIKVPYSNAGQGVYTIVSQRELDNFMARDFEYNKFIVQSLIGNYLWSSNSEMGKLYHVGSIPSKKGYTFVTDVRLMLSSTNEGLKPICVYARRAQSPLLNELSDGEDSWSMLGTNLSIKHGQNDWSSDTSRLVLMDRRDFNRLGLGMDDLIDGYVQTVLSTIAIEKMAQSLLNARGRLRKSFFQSYNNDQQLLDEIRYS